MTYRDQFTPEEKEEYKEIKKRLNSIFIYSFLTLFFSFIFIPFFFAVMFQTYMMALLGLFIGFFIFKIIVGNTRSSADFLVYYEKLEKDIKDFEQRMNEKYGNE